MLGHRSWLHSSHTPAFTMARAHPAAPISREVAWGLPASFGSFRIRPVLGPCHIIHIEQKHQTPVIACYNYWLYPRTCVRCSVRCRQSKCSSLGSYSTDTDWTDYLQAPPRPREGLAGWLIVPPAAIHSTVWRSLVVAADLELVCAPNRDKLMTDSCPLHKHYQYESSSCCFCFCFCFCCCSLVLVDTQSRIKQDKAG